MEQTHDQQMFIPGEWVTLTRGRYRILSELGKGGQSAVWKAVRERDGQTVALRTVNLFDAEYKSVHATADIVDLVAYATAEANFLKAMDNAEAQAHFIVPILDDGYITHPQSAAMPLPTTVMPWYSRGDLHQFARAQGKGAFNGHDLLRWARQVTTALVYIHQQHQGQQVSVHRDLKPQNILLGDDGNVGLTDFGIVRAAASSGTSTRIASADYCAPEQRLAAYKKANGHKQYLITPAVDIYSLAITLHELLAGQTGAQGELRKSTTVDEHDDFLPPSGKVQRGRIGKLGKLGGLTEAEKRHLRGQLLVLFQRPPQGETLAVSKYPTLPEAGFVADGMVGVLERMLAPWLGERPSAAAVLADFTALEQSLNPVLAGLGVSLRQAQLTVGQTCTLRLAIRGSGLPADLRWLRFERNGQPLAGLKPAWGGVAVHGLLPADVEQSVGVDVPLSPETGEYRLKVSATVAGKVHSQQVVCHVTLTAEQWWGLGKHEAALRMELRPAWLAERQRQANTLPQRNALHTLLLALQQHYQADPAAIAHLAEALRQVNELAPPPDLEPVRDWRKLALLGAALPVLALGGYYLNAGDSPATAPTRQALEPTMVNIPAGKFTMGCDGKRDDVEGGCSSDEKPAHEVSISAFQMAKTETTVAQFRAFVDATGYKTTAEEKGSCWSFDDKGSWDDVKGNSWRKLGFEQGDDHPVACVSWDDTQAYLKWLNKASGKTYRLPTEAEWEYAARGGKDGAYPWGNAVGKGNANCYQDQCGDKFDYTSPVDSFAENPFHLRDMHGNVWEWCSDRYDSSYYAPSPASDPQGASSGADRVLRGGSWNGNAQIVRSAYRGRNTPDNRRSIIGFRLASGRD